MLPCHCLWKLCSPSKAVNHLKITTGINTTIWARVFDDNQSAYFLATNHQITNCTQYFLNKWHWFWDSANEFTIFKVDTHNQDANFLGKALSRQLFEDNCFRVQGRWGSQNLSARIEMWASCRTRSPCASTFAFMFTIIGTIRWEGESEWTTSVSPADVYQL